MSRCWTYETSIALGVELSDDLPYNTYFNYFEPDYKLHIHPKDDLENKNNTKSLHRTIMTVFDNLAKIEAVPSVQMQEVPHPFVNHDQEDGEMDENVSETQLPRL